MPVLKPDDPRLQLPKVQQYLKSQGIDVASLTSTTAQEAPATGRSGTSLVDSLKSLALDTPLIPAGLSIGAGIATGGAGFIPAAIGAGLTGAAGEAARQGLKSTVKDPVFDPGAVAAEGVFGLGGEVGGRVLGQLGRTVSQSPVGEGIKKGVSKGVAGLLRATINAPQPSTERILARTSQTLGKEAGESGAFARIGRQVQESIKEMMKSERAVFADAKASMSALRKTVEKPTLEKAGIPVKNAVNNLLTGLREEGLLSSARFRGPVREMANVGTPQILSQLGEIADKLKTIRGRGAKGLLTFDEADFLTKKLNSILDISSRDVVSPIGTSGERLISQFKKDLFDAIAEKVPGFAERNARYRQHLELFDAVRKQFKDPVVAEDTITKFGKLLSGSESGFAEKSEALDILKRLGQATGKPFLEETADVGARRAFETSTPTIQQFGLAGIPMAAGVFTDPRFLAALPLFSKLAVKTGLRGAEAGTKAGRPFVPRALSQLGLRNSGLLK